MIEVKIFYKKEQARNRKNNVFIEYLGKRKTISEWSEITGIRHDTIRYRLINNWEIKNILLFNKK